MLGNLGQLADLLKNAGKIRESVNESLAQIETQGSAGGGQVTAKVNGRFEVLELRIDPQVFERGDRELLEDLVAGAVNQALLKAKEQAAQSLGSLAGGFPLPGLDGMFPGGPFGPTGPSGEAPTSGPQASGPGPGSSTS